MKKKDLKNEVNYLSEQDKLNISNRLHGWTFDDVIKYFIECINKTPVLAKGWQEAFDRKEPEKPIIKVYKVFEGSEQSSDLNALSNDFSLDGQTPLYIISSQYGNDFLVSNQPFTPEDSGKYISMWELCILYPFDDDFEAIDKRIEEWIGEHAELEGAGSTCMGKPCIRDQMWVGENKVALLTAMGLIQEMLDIKFPNSEHVEVTLRLRCISKEGE